MHIQTSDQEVLNIGFGGYTCNWGLHLCGLYETEQERDDILFGFFDQGLKEGDLNLYCPAERGSEDFIARFSAVCSHCVNAVHNHDQFIFKSAKELYYPDGIFSPNAMEDGLSAFYLESQKQGPRHIRASAEMVWALEAIPGVKYLMAYEARLNLFILGKPWVSVCLYNVNKFDGKTILNVLQTHPFTVVKGVITKNPYFVNPETWLRRNAPEFAGI